MGAFASSDDWGAMRLDEIEFLSNFDCDGRVPASRA